MNGLKTSHAVDFSSNIRDSNCVDSVGDGMSPFEKCSKTVISLSFHISSLNHVKLEW